MASKVDVIVPVYNVEKYVGGCLDSLLSQTIKDIKIICVNDGSTDGSLEVLKKYAKKDSRIIVVDQKNGGRSMARNAGLKKVDAPYVMFCDSDDSYDSEMCEKMLKVMEESEADLAVCGIEIIYEAHDEIRESDENYYRLKYYGKNFVDDTLIMKTDASVCNKIFRMSLIKKYGIEFPDKLNNEDYYFYNAYMSVAKTCFFVNRKLYKYIRHEGSIMSDNFDKNSYSPDHLLVAEKLFSFYRKNDFLRGHTDLFWTQFSESFWFSYNHSAKKYHQSISKMAEEFINKYYDRYLPTDKKVKNSVSATLNHGIVYKTKKKIKRILKKVYLKVNIAYRQQNYINVCLDELHERIEELSDKIEKMERE